MFAIQMLSFSCPANSKDTYSSSGKQQSSLGRNTRVAQDVCAKLYSVYCKLKMLLCCQVFFPVDPHAVIFSRFPPQNGEEP